MNDFSLLVGKYNSAFPTLSDTCPSELQLDVNGRLIISGRYLEDSAHVSGDAGIFMMGVRNDNDTVLTSADGDYSAFAVDQYGRLKVLADLDVDFDYIYEEDSAHASGDLGSYVLAVRADARPTDANTSADGDYASFFINNNGELYVHDVDGLAKLTEIDAVLDTIYTEQLDQGTTLDSIESEIQALSHLEDVAHASGDAGIMTLAVRKDALASSVDADGDYGSLKLNSKGELYVTDTDAIAKLTEIDVVLDNIYIDTSSIDASISALSHAEDSAHVSGDQGIMSLGVRNDTDADLTDADGDYSPINLDSAGRIKISSELKGDEAYNASDDLAIGGDGLISGIDETFTDVVSIAVGAGETLCLYGFNWEADENAAARIISLDGANTVVYKMSLNSSAMPGRSEHFSEGGRIEIAGAAGKVVKLQIRKRNANCPDLNGFGSLHARIV